MKAIFPSRPATPARTLRAGLRILQNALAVLLIISASLHAAEPSDGFPNFVALRKDEAVKAARRQAEADFAAGRYRMLVYGLRRQTSEQDTRLAKDGVEVRAIAGCIVSDGILEGARVYNEVMRAKLKAKLGRDVFSENDEARKQNAK